MAFQRSESVVVPSIALTTWSAIRHPEAVLELEWAGRDDGATAMYRTDDGTYLRPRDYIPFTSVFGAMEDAFALREDEMLAVIRLPLSPLEHWQEQTVDYADLLLASDQQLRERVAGRIVLVGDLRKPRWFFPGDRHAVRYGADVVPDVPGCYLLADSIAGVCRRRYLALASPLSATMLMSIIAFGAVGVAVPVRLAKHARIESLRPRGLIYVALATLVGACVVALGCSTSAAMVWSAMAGFALGVPMMGSFAVEFTRNRHRIIERKDREVQVETDQPLPERTLTINEPRRQPIPKAG